MSIFSGLFRSRDKPQNKTAGSSYTFFMGGSTSGKSVTERSAMQMTAVYACVRILAEAIAELPLHLYRYTDAGEEISALSADLSAGLTRLSETLADIQVIFDDAENAFDELQLPEEE